MAAQTSFILQEEELSCPICFEEFNLNDKSRQPKLLLCLHTFCLECMETLRKYDGTLQCSICRTSHHVYRVCDLMDNYLIFEHLRIKQEIEDEKLAEQFKEEYEQSVRALKEQEERDAQLAKEEDAKNRLEVERLRKEEEKRKEEYEKQELERLERLRREEEERLRIERREVEERLRMELEQERLEEQRKREEEERERTQQINTEASLQILSDIDSFEDRESSSDSTETRSDHSDDTAEESDTEDESFQEVECEHSDDDSPTSVVDDYETLSSDTDHYSTEIISSDEHENPQETETSTNTKNSQHNKRSRSASPVPDFLSEEFSGVAPMTSTPKAPKESLSKLLPSVNCMETQDGTITILDSSTDEQVTSDVKANPSQDLRSKAGNSGPFRSSIHVGDSDSEHETKDLSSSEEECHSFRMEKMNNVPTGESRTTRSSGVKGATSLHLENDENCKLQ